MRRFVLPLALAIAIPFAGPALADQPLPADQLAKVKALLRQEGFSKWKESELDDGMIEVDDAVDANGQPFDLKLDPTNLAIRTRKAD